MGDSKYCNRCMEQYDSSLQVCPSCGYVESSEYDPMYVPPGTILHGKYLCGILLEYNGEGATYAGCDIATGKKVFIREYMPINLCSRVKNKPTISVNYNNLAKYKAFMAEYTELNKSLARLRNNPNIPPVLDMFAENNTTYTIFEYIEGVKMLDYLKENAGEVSWEEVSKIFPPLFTTIGILHNAGIIHRAISPDTLYITDKGELKLWGFCVSAVRTANAGLEYELFKGYAAPEQYSASSSSRQGSWTDVYGVCALLYRALTGCMPVDSVSRQNHDDLHEPNMLDPGIPRHVSRVIMEGMNLNGRDRIQTITELVTKLFEQPSEEENSDEDFDSTLFLNDRSGAVPPVSEPEPVIAPAYHAVQPSAPLPDDTEVIHQHSAPAYSRPVREDSYDYEKGNTVDRIKVPVIIGLLFLSILLIIFVYLMHLFSPDEEANKSSARSKRSTIVSNNSADDTTTTTSGSAEKNITVPKLVGKFYEFEKDKWTDFKLEPVYSYNDEYESDMIFEQSVAEGEMIAEGDTIVIKVSKGKGKATVPDYSGKTVNEYKNALETAGISKHNYQFIESDTAYGKAGTIVELRSDGKIVSPGSVFDCSTGKKLAVYYVSDKASSQVTTSAAATTTTAAATTTHAATTTVQATTTQAPVTTPAPTTAPPTEPPTEPPTDPPTEPPTDAPPVEPTTIDDGGQG